jgi:hypothetical protein
VEETVEGMFTLEKKVGAIAEQIVHLSEQANQIGVRIQVSAIGMKGGRLRPRIHESIPRLGGEGFPP